MTTGFEVALIPHTVAHTAFAQTRVGDAVNLEVDLVARYVERLLQSHRQNVAIPARVDPIRRHPSASWDPF